MFDKVLKDVAADIKDATGLKTVIDKDDVTLPCVLVGFEDSVKPLNFSGTAYKTTVSIYLLTADQKTSTVMRELGELLQIFRAYDSTLPFEFMTVTLQASVMPVPALKATAEITFTVKETT